MKLSTAGPRKGESGATSSVASSWSAAQRVSTRSPPKGRGGNDYSCTAAQTSVLTSLVQSSAAGHSTQAMYTGSVHLLHHSRVLRSRCLSFALLPVAHLLSAGRSCHGAPGRDRALMLAASRAQLSPDLLTGLGPLQLQAVVRVSAKSKSSSGTCSPLPSKAVPTAKLPKLASYSGAGAGVGQGQVPVGTREPRRMGLPPVRSRSFSMAGSSSNNHGRRSSIR